MKPTNSKSVLAFVILATAALNSVSASSNNKPETATGGESLVHLILPKSTAEQLLFSKTEVLSSEPVNNNNTGIPVIGTEPSGPLSSSTKNDTSSESVNRVEEILKETESSKESVAPLNNNNDNNNNNSSINNNNDATNNNSSINNNDATNNNSSSSINNNSVSNVIEAKIDKNNVTDNTHSTDSKIVNGNNETSSVKIGVNNNDNDTSTTSGTNSLSELLTNNQNHKNDDSNSTITITDPTKAIVNNNNDTTGNSNAPNSNNQSSSGLDETLNLLLQDSQTTALTDQKGNTCVCKQNSDATEKLRVNTAVNEIPTQNFSSPSEVSKTVVVGANKDSNSELSSQNPSKNNLNGSAEPIVRSNASELSSINAEEPQKSYNADNSVPQMSTNSNNSNDQSVTVGVFKENNEIKPKSVNDPSKATPQVLTSDINDAKKVDSNNVNTPVMLENQVTKQLKETTASSENQANNKTIMNGSTESNTSNWFN